jgi:hypothetical protein
MAVRCNAPLELDTGEKQDTLCPQRSAKCQEGISQPNSRRGWC